MKSGICIRRIIIFPAILAATLYIYPQPTTQVIKGIVIDKDSRAALTGANVTVINSSPLAGSSTDEKGKFSLRASIGRVSLKVTYLGYEELFINDILVATGKEIVLSIEMTEKVMKTDEIVVTASGKRQSSINQMAAISTNTVRPDDALRYAGGFYDPSRIVNAFAGVVTANSDESNDLVIRGNSSRGLLWRLEGIEVPNPNHFSDGQGGSGGGYSAITSNVISTFDFFTGAFPAEYGNAISGVMDLNLRKGNPDNYEFAFQTGMIGAEISSEGPLIENRGSSFLLNARYVNFSILSNLGLIDLGETNYSPRSADMVYNFYLPSASAGSFNIFGFLGKSEIGKIAVRDPSSWISESDRWEEFESLGSAVVGLKHIFSLPGSSSYIRSVLAYTFYKDSYSEGFIDSSFTRTNSYYSNFRYPSLRYSVMMNNKLSSRHVIRSGININFLGAGMQDYKMNSTGAYDTLVSPEAFGIYSQWYVQLKSRVNEKLEFNSGFHVVTFSVNGDMNVEPRLGMRWQITPGNYLNAGAGLHSRIESFPVYYNLVKNRYSELIPANKNLGFSKSLHLVTGIDLTLSRFIRLRVEGYNQQLFEIPIIYNQNSRYSAINSAEDLPSAELKNKGTGFNRGIELTLEKLYSSNYYFLYTLSLFNSKYRAGDNNWYNTYYNTSYVTNFLAGKDFYFGNEKRNSIGVNFKTLLHGGYRYTPVDMARSIKLKRIVYNTSRTYEEQLPDFFRCDAGINYRRNNSGFSWIIMVDIQNVSGNKNVFRKRFNYVNNKIIETNVYSLGTVPVLNLRIEF